MSKVNKSYHGHEDPIIDYCTGLTIKLHPLQQELQDATLAHHKMYVMLGAPEVLTIGQNFLKLIQGKNCLDIGTFTGASALAWALAIPDDGKVVTMDVDHSALDEIGRPVIDKCSKTAHKIDFRLGSAIDTLDKLIAEGKSGQFDFAFIDADKENYTNYYDKCMQLLRPGGVILVDNALWSGRVTHENKSPDSAAIDACNRHISADKHSHSFLVNTGDGLHVAFKA
ncbi:unnamed protein product, partial [Mesorhabditis belari]|uniref:O-methyltransferase n=1 Tax=Mesorhabditis belari TaxID=2138241 RepID=A0AAF3J3N6_9BILA